jgi:hypothetical protein
MKPRLAEDEFPSPQFATINTWTKISGLTRRAVYRHLASGNLRAVKLGKRTLIDVEFGLAWIRSQPLAKIRVEPALRGSVRQSVVTELAA